MMLIACSKCGSYFKRSDSYEDSCVKCGKVIYYPMDENRKPSSIVTKHSTSLEDLKEKYVRLNDGQVEELIKDHLDGMPRLELQEKYNISYKSYRYQVDKYHQRKVDSMRR